MTSAVPEASSGRILAGTLGVGLVLVTVALYWTSLGNAFQNWDEHAQIVVNPRIRSWSWENLQWMFTSLDWTHWTPLGWLSHTATYTLFGPDPFWHHLVSVLHHGLNAVILFTLVLELNRAREHRVGDGPWARPVRDVGVAGMVALLFAVHPVNVESVAWLVSRKDLLCFTFLGLSTIAYLRYVGCGASARRTWLYGIFLGSYLLALMTKSIAVTLPLVLVLIDLYLGRQPDRDPASPRHRASCMPPLTDKLVPLLLAVVAGLIAVQAARHGGSLVETMHHGPVDRLLVALGNVTFYLTKLVFPILLSPYYPIPERFDTVHYISAWLGAGILLALGLALVVSLRNGKRPGVLLALVAYLVLLGPVIGITQNGRQLAADRYAYLASAPLYILLGGVIQSALRRLETSGAKRAVLAGMTVLAVVAVLLGHRTLAQLEVWRSPVTFWEHVVRLYPTSELGRVNLALMYLEEGRGAQSLAELEAAGALAGREGNRVNDAGIGYDGIFILLADRYLALGRMEHALEALDAAARHNPGNPDVGELRQIIRQRMRSPSTSGNSSENQPG